MEAVYGWLRDVAVFFLLMTTVLNVLPEAKYRKYVQFFLGLVMLVVLCRPILALGDMADSLENVLDRLTLEEEARGLRESQIRIDGLQQEVLYGAYEDEMERQIETFLTERGWNPVRVEVSIGEDGEGGVSVERIEVTAQKSVEEEEGETGSAGGARELKRELAEIYQVSEAHIIVKLQA